MSYSLETPLGGMTQGTVNASNLGASWDIASVVSRGAKIAAAKGYAVSVNLDVARQEWQTAEAAKLQIYHLYYLDRQLAVTRQEEKDLDENLDRIKRGAALGFVTVTDLAAADASPVKARSTDTGEHALIEENE